MPKHCINIDGVVDNKTLVQVRSTLNTVIEHAKALREEQAQATGITWTLQGPGPAAGAAGGLGTRQPQERGVVSVVRANSQHSTQKL